MSWLPIFDRVEIIGIALVSLDGRVVQCNQRFADIIGDDMLHIAGRHVLDFTSTEDRERARTNLNALTAGQVDRVSHEKRYVSKSGASIPCRLLSLLVRDSEFKPAHLLSWIYTVESSQSDTERIQKLEVLLSRVLEALANQGGTEVRIDNSQGKVTSTNSHNDNSSKSSSVSISVGGLVSAVLVLAIIGLLVFVAAGGMQLIREVAP